MKLSIAIVGLPNVGKSTLFKILTKQQVHIANYPFTTINPNLGVVAVPDERLQKLAALTNTPRIIPATVEFYDIAGLVKNANKGEGLGNQFLAHIRETQAIVIVLRVFQNTEIIHVENSVDPLRDLKIINVELALKDLETATKHLQKLEADARGGDKSAIKNLDIIKHIAALIGRGEIPARYSNEEIVREMGLLTTKRQLYLLNGKEGDVTEELLQEIKKLGVDYIVSDLAHTEVLSQLIKKAYEILDLVSFFTFNDNETRAWTITRGTLAPQAAGVIHSDFEKNFIRAEVVSYPKLVEAGSPSMSSGQSPWAIAKQKGWVRLEGKEYAVQDGDVILVRSG